MQRRYRRVDLRSGAWSVERVAVPTTFAGRLRGRAGRRATAHRPVLLAVAAIHTMGCRRSLLAVPLSADGVVRGHAIVAPGSLRWFRGARWILELDVGVDPPPTNARLTVVASS